MALVLVVANACVYGLAFILGSLGPSPKFITNWIIVAAVINSVVDVLVPLLANLFRRRLTSNERRTGRAATSEACIALLANALLGIAAMVSYLFI